MQEEARSTLTKKFLMGLNAGVWVASNVCRRMGEPVFVEEIVGLAGRADQWDRIKAAGVNGRLCLVFSSKTAFQQWKREAVKTRTEEEIAIFPLSRHPEIFN